MMAVKLRLSKPQQQALRLIAAGGCEWRSRDTSDISKILYHVPAARWLREDTSSSLPWKGLCQRPNKQEPDSPAFLTELGAQWVAENPEEKP